MVVALELEKVDVRFLGVGFDLAMDFLGDDFWSAMRFSISKYSRVACLRKISVRARAGWRLVWRGERSWRLVCLLVAVVADAESGAVGDDAFDVEFSADDRGGDVVEDDVVGGEDEVVAGVWVGLVWAGRPAGL